MSDENLSRAAKRNRNSSVSIIRRRTKFDLIEENLILKTQLAEWQADAMNCLATPEFQKILGMISDHCASTEPEVNPQQGGAIDSTLARAAPDLLAALKAVEWCGFDGWSGRAETCCPKCMVLKYKKHKPDCIISAALAKARGEETK